ncbi:hypothetical protein QVD99_004479 [Batrachochytrium dendrobatidis]|nr:hypothetical protein QVD99_004479 [Batrachochytrium dendrobatidis]
MLSHVYGWKALCAFGLAALAQAATHDISITMTVDDTYDLTLDGVCYQGPESTSSLQSWQNVQTYTKKVDGDGPWLIAIEGQDIGTIAGLFAAVKIDGVPYSTTATSNNLFVMTADTPKDGWKLDVNYDDSDWHTQTTDTCTDYKTEWATLLPTLDSKTGKEIARSMWYPNCRNTGTIENPKSMYFRLVLTPPSYAPPSYIPPPPPPPTTHILAITMAVDDSYDLNLDGQKISVPYTPSGWQSVKTYTKTVVGDGPWLISVKGYDDGTIAGFFSVVTLDGVPYSTTATATNKFRMTPNTPAAGWDSSLSFDDKSWYTQTIDSCTNYSSFWAALLPNLDAQTKGQVARAMWYPDCYNTGTVASPKPMYFRLTVGGPKSPAIPANPNPVPTHTLAITMAVDDSYDLNLDGQKISVPYTPSGWQSVKTYTKTVVGDGPWLISVKGYDDGTIAGFFSVVTLDGVPYSTTATATNKFRMTPNTPAAGWDSSLSFDDKSWYTQTIDSCTNYSSFWAALLPNLDAQTKGQVARAMWYPDCYNTGTVASPKPMYFRLTVGGPKSSYIPANPNPVPTHTLAITMAVDDSYDLNLDGQKISVPYTPSGWQSVKTYTKTVVGDGPWLISVKGYDDGTIAGFFSVVTLDGVPYSTTATATNKFRMTPNTPAAGWDSSLSFDDKGWYTQTIDSCTNYSSFWAALLPNLDAQTKGQVARAMWYPDCYNTGTVASPKPMYFRLTVGGPKSPAIPANPNPVPTHTLAITMAVDDSYDLNLDGQKISVPYTPSGWQSVKTYTKTVVGDGPWLISVKGYDDGTIAGFFSVVTLDGVPYSTTATATNKFRMTPNTPAAGWDSSLSFDDKGWYTQTIDSCTNYSSFWAALLPNLDAQTKGQVARAMWYPDCYNTGTVANPKPMYFRLTVGGPKSSYIPANPNPVSTHTLAITMAVDDFYTINIDGAITSVPYTPSGWQSVKTYTKTVFGDGPWLISVKGNDVGNVAGLFAVVTLDGTPYTTTASPTNKFRMYPNTPAAGWDSSLSFDDKDWYTQTYDSCTDYNDQWTALLPNLDAQTKGQVARSMWYPNCKNTGTVANPKPMYFRLTVGGPKSPSIPANPNPVPSHSLVVTMAVDDYYDLTIDGKRYTEPKTPTSWQSVKTYTKTVIGDGPWLVSVHGYDVGNVAGLFAVVTLDGVPYSTTATATNKFRMTSDTPAAGWDTSLSFDDKSWYTQTTDSCTDYNDQWAALLPGLDSMTKPQVARSMWYPNCKGTGTNANPKSNYFRLTVGGPKSPAIPANPNPVSTHTLAITMAVDDFYTINIDGAITSVPYTPSGWQSVKTYTKTVIGDGPWLISVKGNDVGNVAGLFAVVTLDGVPYSTTATATNKFRMSPYTPAAGWDSSLSFDDKSWYTQTYDSCTDYNNQWTALLPNLDAQTKGQVARSMWYPDCKNTGTVAIPKPMYFRLTVSGPKSPAIPANPNPVPTHSLAITMAVDDFYTLRLDGQTVSVPYTPSGWQSVKTYTKTVVGDGPWLISVKGNDVGNVAGLFAVVTLDGVPYSTTATATNKFRMTPNTPAAGWDTDAYFSDASWYTQTYDSCTQYANQWTALLPGLDTATKPQVARSMWYPDCKNTGTVANPKPMYFRLVVAGPGSSYIPASPNPVSTHTLSITIAVDDNYVLNLDGQQHSIAYSDNSWRQVNTYTKTVVGDGPWLISVHAYDSGTIAGFFSSVFVDGVPYSTTATATNKFRMTPNTPAAGWDSSLSFDDKSWYTQTVDVCTNYANLWAALLPNLDAQTKGQVARPMWYPNCYNTGTVASPKSMYFRLLAVSSKASPIPANPNPSSTPAYQAPGYTPTRVVYTPPVYKAPSPPVYKAPSPPVYQAPAYPAYQAPSYYSSYDKRDHVASNSKHPRYGKSQNSGN